MNEELPRASESDGRSIWEIRASYREIIVKSLGEMMNMMSTPVPRDHTFVTIARNCACLSYHVMGMLVRDICAKKLDSFSGASEAAEYLARQLADESLDREQIVRAADAASHISFDALDQTQAAYFDWLHVQEADGMTDGDFPLRRFLSESVDEAVAVADSAKSEDGSPKEDGSDVGK